MATSEEILKAIQDGSFGRAMEDAVDGAETPPEIRAVGYRLASRHKDAAFEIMDILQRSKQDFGKEPLSAKIDMSQIELLAQHRATMAAVEILVET